MNLFELNPIDFKIYYYIKQLNSRDKNKEGYTNASLEMIDAECYIYKHLKTTKNSSLNEVLRSIYRLKNSELILIKESDNEINGFYLRAIQ